MHTYSLAFSRKHVPPQGEYEQLNRRGCAGRPHPRLGSIKPLARLRQRWAAEAAENTPSTSASSTAVRVLSGDSVGQEEAR